MVWFHCTYCSLTLRLFQVAVILIALGGLGETGRHVPYYAVVEQEVDRNTRGVANIITTIMGDVLLAVQKIITKKLILATRNATMVVSIRLVAATVKLQIFMEPVAICVSYLPFC